MDYAAQKKRMIEEQLARRGIEDKAVLDVFGKVERHKFVPVSLTGQAYADYPLPIGEGQTISQPYIVALMVERLKLSGKEKVLEVGAGSGYQTAILAELAGEVYAIERLDSLRQGAQELLKELGYTNVKIKSGDGTLGWPQEAPFERIIVSCAADSIPPVLSGQLKEGGILVIPLGGPLEQMLTVARKEKGRLVLQEVCACVFVPLLSHQ